MRLELTLSCPMDRISMTSKEEKMLYMAEKNSMNKTKKIILIMDRFMEREGYLG